MTSALMIALVVQRYPDVMPRLAGVESIWKLASSLISFCLSFFLSQSYSLWRNVYSCARRVQGRLNDLGLLGATAAQRTDDTGEYAEGAEALLKLNARYIRLFA